MSHALLTNAAGQASEADAITDPDGLALPAEQGADPGDWPWLEIPIFGRCLPMAAALSELELVATSPPRGRELGSEAAAFFGAASARGCAVLERRRRLDHRARGGALRHTARRRRLVSASDGVSR